MPQFAIYRQSQNNVISNKQNTSPIFLWFWFQLKMKYIDLDNYINTFEYVYISGNFSIFHFSISTMEKKKPNKNKKQIPTFSIKLVNLVSNFIL